jgi:hypothetical protein
MLVTVVAVTTSVKVNVALIRVVTSTPNDVVKATLLVVVVVSVRTVDPATLNRSLSVNSAMVEAVTSASSVAVTETKLVGVTVSVKVSVPV